MHKVKTRVCVLHIRENVHLRKGVLHKNLYLSNGIKKKKIIFNPTSFLYN